MNASLTLRLLAAVTAVLAMSACNRAAPAAPDAPYGGYAPAGDAGMNGYEAGAANPMYVGAADAKPAVAQGAAAPLPPLDTSRMQPVEIRDSKGGVAATAQIPVGWQATGGVTVDPSTPCASNMVKVAWSAIGPDSLTTVELMPGFNWQVQGSQSPMNPCPVAPFRAVRDFMMATVQETRPGARVLDFEKQPQMEQQAAEAARGQGGQGAMQYDAGRMLIGYQKDGVEMREVLVAVLGLSNAGGSVMGNVGIMSSVRAPDGRLDMDLSSRIQQSLQPNPQWMQMLKQQMLATVQNHHARQAQQISDWHNRKMAMINAKGAADRHAVRMRANQDVANTYNAIAGNTGATSDGMHATTMSGVREVNNYTGVDGTTVENSIHNGPRVFQDTNDPNNAYSSDQPYAQPANGYVELEPTP